MHNGYCVNNRGVEGKLALLNNGMIRGHGDTGTRGHGDMGTRGHGDMETRGLCLDANSQIIPQLCNDGKFRDFQKT
ncbi:hypothetical protein [Nostoc linckia]|uniref:hypothetical protein n=1 Tax=Nostoc linckia TaxID=92942 RepID=UPI00117FE989|nr:hypothetical protein [Nostoc linckia]